MPENILLETHGKVGLIRLNRPKVLNALNTATINEIAHSLEAWASNPEIGSVVITGNERAFAAGADILEMSGMGVTEMLERTRQSKRDAIQNHPKPIVAAVSGFCLGGGFELALLADIIVASESARFGLPEINLGILPGGGGTQRLARVVGKSLAMEMVLNARMIGAEEAKGLGIASRVAPVETHLEHALQLAMQIADRAPVAVRLAKQSVLKALENPDGLEFERQNFALLFGTQDQKEGMNAFLEKRAPKWKGQ